MQKEHNLTDAEVLRNSLDYPWMFGILVDRYQKDFLRKGLSILHSKDEVEDAVQESFIKIYRHAGSYREQKGASFKSWSYKILVNTCYTIAAKKQSNKERFVALDFTDLDLVSAIDQTEEKDRASLVSSVLSKLPEHFVNLLKQYFFEGKSYAEIALTEDMSLSSVKSGLYRAKQQFKSIATKMLL